MVVPKGYLPLTTAVDQLAGAGQGRGLSYQGLAKITHQWRPQRAAGSSHFRLS